MDPKQQFEEKAAVRQAVGRVLTLLVEYRRGTVVPWGVIEEAAGFGRLDGHWTTFWHRLRRDFLRSSGICLWPRRHVGVRLLTVQEQLTERAVARRRRAFRQMRRDEQELAAVPDADMSVRQRTLKASQLLAAREAKRQVLRQLRLSHVLSRPSGDGRIRPSDGSNR